MDPCTINDCITTDGKKIYCYRISSRQYENHGKKCFNFAESSEEKAPR
ncbi:MAG: hypothetical protein GY820_03145 [Gammaproteobacteria bacterium]|nr:hypothetical protein [Gammaproteobacteria bacterium]